MELEEEKLGNSHVLNVVFDLPRIAVDLPGVSPGPWQFQFTDYKPGVPISEIKRELGAMEEEHFIAIVLFEAAKSDKIYYPHRFKVEVIERPSAFTKGEFQDALLSALGRVLTEMEIRLRQSFYRQADPQIGYGRVIDVRCKEIVTTHRARFM